MTIKLVLALTLIRAFELILREQDVLSEMLQTSRTLLRRKKAVIVSMPLLIGLLPSVGGAYFSAPMVDESTKGIKMSQEEKGFIKVAWKICARAKHLHFLVMSVANFARCGE